MLGQTTTGPAKKETSDGVTSPFNYLFSSVNLERVLRKEVVLES